MEDKIFDIVPKVNKNSYNFDKELLNSIIGLIIPEKDFDKVMRRIFRQKSSCKLWFEYYETPYKIWDGKEYHEVNYRCCPSSHKARYYFGLWLDRVDVYIVVDKGWLSAT